MKTTKISSMNYSNKIWTIFSSSKTDVFSYQIQTIVDENQSDEEDDAFLIIKHVFELKS